MPAGDSRRKNNTCLGFEVWSLELLIKKIFYFFIYIISYRRKSIKKLIDRYRFLYLIFEFQGPMFCGRKTKLAWVLRSGEMAMLQGVQEKLCFFIFHCNPSLAYTSLQKILNALNAMR